MNLQPQHRLTGTTHGNVSPYSERQLATAAASAALEVRI